MNLKDINDKLVLVYEKSSGKPLGSGFFINEFGHFITCYHVVKDYASIKDDICCAWKERSYRVRYIQSLTDNGFYKALKESTFTIDLIILELIIPNKNFEVEHLPTLPFDMNAQLPKSFKVSFKGFNCEKYKKREEAELSEVTTILNNYKVENGLWLFTGESEIWRGYSGSPVLHPQLGEAMGVVVSRSPENKQIGAIQSLHMLKNELKSYDDNYERSFRSPFSLYGEYHKGKCRSFEKKEWPYAIDKKEFVDAFDFKIGRFPLKKQWAIVKSEEECVPFIIDQLKEHSVFCIGYYGMGKTTISKFLFTEYFSYSGKDYPVFISLENARLSVLNPNDWKDFVTDKICQDFKKRNKDGPYYYMSDGLRRQYFRHLIEHTRIVLIFDGIDEALWDRPSLREFAGVIKSLPCNYFLTSRREFYAFVDVFGDQMANCPHHVIELMPWRKKQWQKYIENLYEKYPDKFDRIKALGKALDKHEYGTLPERPLFLKMISDLELDNETNLEEEIPPQLKKNRAAVYYAYVRWKIKDDFKRKGPDIPKEYREDIFIDEALQLFQGLANIEYEGSVPKSGAVGYFKQGSEGRDIYTFSAFTLKDIKKESSTLDLLDPEFVQKNLFGSTFFSMLKEEDKKLFRFSHKSFCEYLVACNLAQSIFSETVEEAKCGQAWDFYQTHEVSAHFQDEIERIRHVKNLDKGAEKLYLQKAFKKVLLAENELRDYSERFEEVLYYTGKFKIGSSKISDLLEKMTIDPTQVHPIYYRTAHISLSMEKSVEYCLKYVEYLIESFYSDKEAFEWNRDIQINYYGKANLHTVLKEDIDRFINEGKLEGILPLEIFSYLTCIPFDATEVGHSKEYLKTIRRICVEHKHTRMTKIIDETLPILESISRIN